MDVSKTFTKRNTLHLQKFGNFPVEIDLTTSDKVQSTDVNGEYLKNGQESLISKTPKNPKIDLFNY